MSAVRRSAVIIFHFSVEAATCRPCFKVIWLLPQNEVFLGSGQGLALRLLPLLQREKTGPVAGRNGEMRDGEHCSDSRSPLPLASPNCVGSPSSSALRERTISYMFG